MYPFGGFNKNVKPGRRHHLVQQGQVLTGAGHPQDAGHGQGGEIGRNRMPVGQSKRASLRTSPARFGLAPFSSFCTAQRVIAQSAAAEPDRPGFVRRRTSMEGVLVSARKRRCEHHSHRGQRRARAASTLRRRSSRRDVIDCRFARSDSSSTARPSGDCRAGRGESTQAAQDERPRGPA